MAEAFINHFASDRFFAESAGIEPGKLNPVVVEAMKDVGIDISKNTTKSVKTFLDQGKNFDYVITVCDETSAERCPSFPGRSKRVHMGFADPSSFVGTPEDKLKKTKEVRDQIRKQLQEWVKKEAHDGTN